MKARILIVLGLILLGNTVDAHPIHVSVVNLDFVSDSAKIDYSIRLFYKDFQTFINYHYNTMIDFSRQTRMTTKEQQSITEYISNSFFLSVNDSVALNSKFISWKIEGESIWLFFCTRTNKSMSELHIHNTLLTDLFNDQINYVIFRNADEEVGVEFNKRKTKHIFKL